MSNIVELYTGPRHALESERLRIIAQRALAPPNHPFDGLPIEAAMILSQLGLAVEIPLSVSGESEDIGKIDEPFSPTNADGGGSIDAMDGS